MNTTHTRPSELDFTSVTIRYGDGAPAVRDCSFRIASGERVALIGANGSGKTTILSAAVGLIGYEGEITVAGKRVEARTLSEIRARIGYLFSTPEDQILFPHVLEDVGFTLAAGGMAEEAVTRASLEVLESLGAADLADRSPYRLSHGQRLRVALAGAMVARPPLLLLDEPTSGLDPAGRRLLAAQLEGRGAACVLATHDVEFATRVCSRYLFMEEGRIVGEGEDFEAVQL